MSSQSFERVAEELRIQAANEHDSAAHHALLAAYWVAMASWTGSYASKGAYARDKSCRAVLLASHHLAKAVLAAPGLPIASEAEACALQAEELLEAVQHLVNNYRDGNYCMFRPLSTGRI